MVKKSSVLKIGGVVATVIGAVMLYFAGTPESTVVSIVGAVFVLAGIIAAVFKPTV